MKQLSDRTLSILNSKTEHDINDYINSIINKEINVGEFEFLSVQRYLNDLKSDKWIFSKEKAFNVINFIQVHCKHIEGSFYGKPLKLEPFQKFMLWNIYGFINKENGFRRFKKAWVQIARKNGKTLLCAALALYHLIEDDEPRGQIFSISSQLSQSKIVFDAASDLVRNDKYLSSRIILSQYKIKNNSSFFQALASQGRKSDGYNPSFVIVDEAHTMDDNGEMVNAMYSGMGSRTQPLLFSITTAGLDLNCWAYKEYQNTIKILRGEVEDDSYFIQNFIMDSKDDWTNPNNWRKANPNLEISVRKEFLEQRLSEAKIDSSKTVDFKTKNLNLWVNSVSNSWISWKDWNKNIYKDSFNEQELQKKVCVGGLDLSSSIDLTAYSLVFPNPDGTYLNKTHFFLPIETVAEAEKRDGIPYRELANKGFLTLTSGNVIDFEEVSDYIKNTIDKYDIQLIACDRWKITDLMAYMPELSYKFIEFSQGYKTMSPATTHFERAILQGKFQLENNPILNNHINNCSIKYDDNSNIKIVKTKRSSGKHIDGIIALIMAHQIALDKSNEFNRKAEDDVFFF